MTPVLSVAVLVFGLTLEIPIVEICVSSHEALEMFSFYKSMEKLLGRVGLCCQCVSRFSERD